MKWLGKTPSHWEVAPLKAVARIEMGQSPASDSYNQHGIGPPFLQGNADFGVAHPSPRHYSEAATKFAAVDDVLFSVRAPVGAINVADQTYGIGRGLCAIRGTSVLSSFLRYALEGVRSELESVATGSTYLAVSVQQVASAKMAIPKMQEQEAVAAFLGGETAKIDALIAEQEKLLALLAEKRQATISHAVTRGLDPSAPMKDSGIQWLGEVPAHWEVKSIKQLSVVQRGASPRPIEDPKYFDDDGEYAWVRISDVTASDGVLLGTEQRLSEAGSSLSVKLDPGDLPPLSRTTHS